MRFGVHPPSKRLHQPRERILGRLTAALVSAIPDDLRVSRRSRAKSLRKLPFLEWHIVCRSIEQSRKRRLRQLNTRVLTCKSFQAARFFQASYVGHFFKGIRDEAQGHHDSARGMPEAR